MAELGASCYFNTKQCVAAWLVLSGNGQCCGAVFAGWLFELASGVLDYCGWGLYILTPYLVVGDDCPRVFCQWRQEEKAFIFYLA